MKPPLPRLHAITDERIARRTDLDQLVQQLATAGPALTFHARGRTLTGLEHYHLAIRLSAHPTIRPTVNDRLDVALAVNAGAVQLGRGSLPPAEARRLNAEWWIGRSVHSLDEARSALTEGADYLLAGPVYATATHPAAAPLGVDQVAEIAAIGLPVIAIGGVTAEGGRVRDLRKAGVYGVAAIRALWDATDPARAAQEMLSAMDDT